MPTRRVSGEYSRTKVPNVLANSTEDHQTSWSGPLAKADSKSAIHAGDGTGGGIPTAGGHSVDGEF